MIRIIKEGFKILLLLAGLLIINSSQAQISLIISGGSSDGINSSVVGTCGPQAIPVKGGSYDGSSAATKIDCSVPTTLVTSGGRNDGILSDITGACNPTAISSIGGSYDGSSALAKIDCSIPTTLITAGGGTDGVLSDITGACIPVSISPVGGSYDGSSALAKIDCSIPTTLVTAGGANDGILSDITGACSPVAISPVGGSYDGSSALAKIDCSVPTTLINSGGRNDGILSDITGACIPVAISPVGGSYDGTDSKVLRCNTALYISSITATGALCQCNGTATVSATGGTAPYTYTWSSGQTTSSVTGLCTGTYAVTVKDATLSTTYGTTTIGQTGQLLASTVTPTPATCGNNNGTATVTTSGGVPPYSYVWSTAETTTTITGLSPGTYTVSISDNGGCSITRTGTILDQATPTVAISSQTNVSCYGGSNGSVSVTLSGGTAPFSYLWSNGVTSSSISSLSVGTYTVTVTDANNCVQTATAIITAPAAITPSVSSQTHVSCNGASNGSITLNPGGGVIPYSYIWNTVPVSTTATISGLTAGTYTVTVMDANSCKVSASSSISQPPVLSVSASVNTPVCYGISINLTSTPTGGTTAYSYSWTGPASYSSTDGNPTIISSTTANSGTYYLTVTDANGCTVASSASVVVTICTTTLNLNVYIEGYYIGSGQMQPTVLNESVPTATGAETDTIYVLLHDTGNPAIVSDSASAILMTTGAATAVFNGTATGNSYWIAIRHRNIIETWSSSAVLFTPVTNYDFTITASQAYGSNMIQVDFSPDLWAVYNGDINQDQNVDLLDFPDMDYGINNGLFGYYNTDLNGDGNVDLLDFPILDANINNGIYSFHP